jgi:hypothetical protein
MYLRACYRRHNGKRHAYWALVESYRTETGPRQRVVAYLGEMDEAGRLGVKDAASDGGVVTEPSLFGGTAPRWVDVDVSRVRVERSRAFGGGWLGLQLLERLELPKLLRATIPGGREGVPWATMALVLVLCRLCDPSSELHIAEHGYERSGLEDLLGVPAEKVNGDRLYRALDRLLPHKVALEMHLKQRLGELFGLQYDLLLYDVTSTYFEGLANGNTQARRGYSRDHRPDCKQVTIALVVSREGMPLAYEVFDGNRTDVTTVEEIVASVESRYGEADRIWVMDRGMVSEDNVAFLKRGKRRYILGTPRGQLKEFKEAIVAGGWETIREGVEVKLCKAPGGEEVFILCRSAQRVEKEKAMHERFAARIEEGLAKLDAACRKRAHKPGEIERRVGKLLGQNTRAAGLFQVEVGSDEQGRAKIQWKRVEAWREWAQLSEGCYLLRSNITDWSAEALWQAYMQLTEAENAFRIHKSDLSLRPIWHQKAERVQAHILVCFLAYVLWKTLGQLCQGAGLGDTPRRVFDELAQIRMVDVVLPTRSGVEIRKRCIARPEPHQAILLQRLGLSLPRGLRVGGNSGDE